MDFAQIGPLALPLTAALVYTVSGLLLKRAMGEGAGLLRLSVVTIATIGLMFQLFWLLVDEAPTWDPWWAPLLCGFLFFAGNVLTFLAIKLGDISVQTPIMGTKTIFVAVCAFALGSGPIPASWWWAALISTVGVFLLTWQRGAAGRATLLGASMAVLSAVFFSAADACLSHFAPSFGALPLVCLMMLTSGIFSFSIVPFFSAPFTALPRRAWQWLVPGAVLTGGQAMLMGYALSVFQQATQANILYSSRGLWSIVLVWFVGHWFGNEERKAAPGLMPQRLLGALLMTGAIVLATLE